MKIYSPEIIENMLNLSTNPKSVKEAFASDPVLFCLIELIYQSIEEKYVLGDESHITENMTSDEERSFVKRKTVEVILDKLNNNQFSK